MSIRQTIQLEKDQAAWVEAEARKRGVTRRELFRQLVESARRTDAEQAERQAAASEPTAPKTPKELQAEFLAAVRRVYDPALAADEAGVPLRLVKRWMAKAGFRQSYEEARHYYRAGVRRDLVEVGRGKIKGGYGVALLGFLNATDEDFGVVRSRAVLKVVDPLLEEWLSILQEELGPQAEAALARVLERMDAAKADRLAQLG